MGCNFMERTIKPLGGSILQRVVNYRNRAAELRIIADDLTLPSEKETLRQIATQYEDMAKALFRVRDPRDLLP